MKPKKSKMREIKPGELELYKHKDCPNHVDDKMDFMSYIHYSEEQHKKGVEQLRCPLCNLWIWPEFWRV